MFLPRDQPTPTTERAHSGRQAPTRIDSQDLDAHFTALHSFVLAAAVYCERDSFTLAAQIGRYLRVETFARVPRNTARKS